jgi:hypoxanthine phosphoribosyltransferase
MYRSVRSSGESDDFVCEKANEQVRRIAIVTTRRLEGFINSILRLEKANHNRLSDRPAGSSCLNSYGSSSTIHFRFQAAGKNVPNLKVLLSREQIQKRVGELGAVISRDFHGQPVVLIGVLKGATIFLGDLARNIALDATFDFISVSSYGNTKQSSGEVKLNKDVDNSMEGKNVILVEDILDTGLTMSYLVKVLAAHRPKALRIAALLDKSARRIQPIHADYVGFEIPDQFVVGYGMDAAERYRNLPDICVVEE